MIIKIWKTIHKNNNIVLTLNYPSLVRNNLLSLTTRIKLINSNISNNYNNINSSCFNSKLISQNTNINVRTMIFLIKIINKQSQFARLAIKKMNMEFFMKIKMPIKKELKRKMITIQKVMEDFTIETHLGNTMLFNDKLQ